MGYINKLITHIIKINTLWRDRKLLNNSKRRQKNNSYNNRNPQQTAPHLTCFY